MAECKPSSKSWAFNTKIKKITIIDGNYFITQKIGKKISEENFPEDIELLQKVSEAKITSPKIQTMGNLDKPRIEEFSETVTTEYTLTYRNTYNICTEDGCDDWYLGPESTIAAGNNDLSNLSKLFGKKITGITPKGYQLDKRSREAEENANVSHAKQIQDVIDSLISNQYDDKFVDTYRIDTVSEAWVPSMYYIAAGVSRSHTYDSIDLPIFGGSADNTMGTGGWLSPSFNYNVQKSGFFLQDWESFSPIDKLGNFLYPESTFYFKKIPGVPDPENKYRRVPPDNYRKSAGGGYAFKSYGYSGPTIDGIIYYTVNQWDGPMPGAVENVDKYGQGTTPINEPIGPFGSALWACTTPDKNGIPEENWIASPTCMKGGVDGTSKQIYGYPYDAYEYRKGTWNVYS